MEEIIRLKNSNTEKVNPLKTGPEKSSKPTLPKFKFRWFKNEIFYLSIYLTVLLTIAEVKF